jgi:glycerophosphodiester phosphodiesterase
MISGQSIREAIRFAKRQNLVGIVSFADPLLKSPKLITTVKAAGLVLATWSSANNDPANIELSHKFGVDAIVIDKIVKPELGLSFLISDVCFRLMLIKRILLMERCLSNPL